MLVAGQSGSSASSLLFVRVRPEISGILSSLLRDVQICDVQIILVGGRHSVGNHRRDALRDGKRAVLHPQGLPWEGEISKFFFFFFILLLCLFGR